MENENEFQKFLNNLYEDDRCDLNLYQGYAEPGYSTDKILVTGNWNRVGDAAFEAFGQEKATEFDRWLDSKYETEWLDEWSACDDCGKIVRASGDCYGWTPSYVINDGGLLCSNCIKNDAEAYLESLEGNPRKVLTPALGIDPEKFGYEKQSEVYETGLHQGMTADPKKIAAQLKEKGVTRFLFAIDEASQFSITFSVYVKKAESVEADEEMEEKEITV